jgi:hypothetical protein
MTTTGLLDIDIREVQALQRELRAVSKDFANAVQNELRAPVTDLANEMKLSARVNLPKWNKMNSNTAAGIRAQASVSGYSVKREADRMRGFEQADYADKTGRIRHPLFGNYAHWYPTDQQPENAPGAKGWWTTVLNARLPVHVEEFTDALLLILDRLATGNLSTSTIASGKTRTKTVL